MNRSKSILLRAIVMILLGIALLPAGALAQQESNQPNSSDEAEAEAEEGEEAANSLAVPYVYVGTPPDDWSESTAAPITVPEEDLHCYDGVCYVIQGTDSWTTSADTRVYTEAQYNPDGTLVVPDGSYVDWGDNMSQEWVDGQYVRIESTVYISLDEAMLGYPMIDMLGETSPLTADEKVALVNDLGLPTDTPELWGFVDTNPATPEFEPVPMTYSFVTDAEGKVSFVYDPDGDPYAIANFGSTATLTLLDASGVPITMEVGSEVNQSGKFIYGGQLKTDAALTDLVAGDYTFFMTFSSGTYTTPTTDDTVLTIVDDRIGGPPEGSGPPEGTGGQGGPPEDTGGQGGPPEDTGGGQGGPPSDEDATDDQQPGQGGQGPQPTATPHGGQGGQGQGGSSQSPGDDDNGSGNGQGGPPEGSGPDSDHEDGEEHEDDGPPEGRGGGQPEDGGGPPEGSGPGSDHQDEDEDHT